MTPLLTAAGHVLGDSYVLDGEDAVDLSGLTPGLDVYCGYEAGLPGYRNGTYDNMAAVKAKFPRASYLSIGRDVIDIEPGLAWPQDAPGFVRQWTPANTDRPVCYANLSTMPSVQNELTLAGIARNRYYLFVADWDGSPDIPPGYDAKQYANTSGYDADSFYSYMFGLPQIPPAAGTYPAPAGFTARGGHTSVAFSWRPVPHATGYRIVIYDDPPLIPSRGAPWHVVKTITQAAPITTHQAGGLIQGKAYQAHIWSLGSPVSSQHNYAVTRFRTG